MVMGDRESVIVARERVIECKVCSSRLFIIYLILFIICLVFLERGKWRAEEEWWALHGNLERQFRMVEII
jgi:hypothetical protein